MVNNYKINIMKLSFYFKQFVVCSLAVGFLASCEKTKEVDDIGDDGHTIVKLAGGGTTDEPGFNSSAIDFVPEPTAIIGADIRRDIPNNKELNRTMVVTVKDDLAAIDAANVADPDLHLEHLDPSWYTVGASTPKTGGAGGTYTVTMAPGEFAKNIDIIIPDATVLDPSTTYALAFTIQTADADGQVSVNKTIITTIGAKNEYDGIYSVVSGTVTRYTNPTTVENPSTLNGSLAGNPDVWMITSGATSLDIPPSGYVGAFYWVAGSNSQVAGIDGLTVTVDPATNLTNIVSATNATLTNWAGKVNKYDPATKTFYLAFRWNPTANVREYEVVLKYKAAR